MKYNRPLRLFHDRQIFPGILAGIVAGVIDIPIEISFAALIFGGLPAEYIPSGIGMALFGAMVIAIVIALTSSYRGMIGLPQDSPAALLALAVTAILAALPPLASGEAQFATAVAAIALTTLATGLFFLIMGWSRLGTLIRFVPYPVIGGFLAGTGWLLFAGGFDVLLGSPLSFTELPALLSPAQLLRWLPSLLFSILLLLALRRSSQILIMPALLLAGILVFYLVLWLAGIPLSQAKAEGWLLGTFSSNALWPPFSLSMLGQIYWPAIFGQVGSIITILFISIISLLLNTSAIELSTRRDMDLNRELKSAGLANLLAGLGGSLVGFQALSFTMLGHRMRTHLRIVGVVTGLLIAVTLFFGGPLLSYIPKPIIGSLLIFLGLSFLVDWLYDGWSKLTKAEYAIVLLILITMNAIGVLAGVGLGLIFAVVLFVINYSRISVVKHTLSGVSYRCNVDRPEEVNQILRKQGDWLYILQLHGFVFFGTANRLLEQVRRRLQATNRLPPRYILLDFDQVTGIDASAVLSFSRLEQLAQSEGLVLVFTELSPSFRTQLAAEVFTNEAQPVWRIEPDLDHGVEWCEEQILQAVYRDSELSSGTAAHRPALFNSLLQALATLPGCQPQVDRPCSIAETCLGPYLVEHQVQPGEYLIHQGDAPRGLFFIESGQITAQLENPDGSTLRLRKMGAGTIVGEIGLYMETNASASVIADETATLYQLSPAEFKRLEAEQPLIAMVLHRYVVKILGERLLRANATMQALIAAPKDS